MHNNRCQKAAAKLLFGRGRPAKERLRRLFRPLYTNLPNHSKQLIAVCGLSLHLGSSESRKTLGKKLSLTSAHLISTVSTSAFHLTNLFLFSRHHIPTNCVVPFFAYKNTTHNFSSRSDEGLTLESSAFKLFTAANQR